MAQPLPYKRILLKISGEGLMGTAGYGLHREKGRVVIFGAGTGNPFFTTDTAAALRAVEMNCDALLKATQVDGVYNADPKRNPQATRYDRLTFDKVITDDLKVMDTAAIALARENRLP